MVWCVEHIDKEVQMRYGSGSARLAERVNELRSSARAATGEPATDGIKIIN